MAKQSPKKNFRKTLAFDLGGTKLAVAVVDERGRILHEQREAADFSGGPKSLVDQFARLGRPLIEKYKLKFGAIGSAGPLDPIEGVFLNATNFKTNGKSWGRVAIVREVEKKLKIKIRLENDAAAAVLAEHWVGAGRGVKDLIVVTLGTGVGVGVVANGELVRSGRNLHPEGGHLIINFADREWLCGCGNYGCAEAYLSGMNFTKNMARIWNEPDMTGWDLVRRGRAGEKKIQAAFLEYGERLASFLCSLCVLFSPTKVVLAGGFSHASDLFLKSCEKHLAERMRSRREGYDLLPKIEISKFQDEAGILGAASVAFASFTPRKNS